LLYYFFFFQAEDGIRDRTVTGVQTCALPISRRPCWSRRAGTAPTPGCARTRRRLRTCACARSWSRSARSGWWAVGGAWCPRTSACCSPLLSLAVVGCRSVRSGNSVDEHADSNGRPEGLLRQEERP